MSCSPRCGLDDAAAPLQTRQTRHRTHRSPLDRDRPAAPDLFFIELKEMLGLLEKNPELGVPYPGKPGARRILLRGSLYHVYYEVARNHIRVLAVWSAVRGREPKL